MFIGVFKLTSWGADIYAVYLASYETPEMGANRFAVRKKSRGEKRNTNDGRVMLRACDCCGGFNLYKRR